MSTDQKGLFQELEPERNGNGRKAQRLFVPKLLSEASKSTWLDDTIDEAHAILGKWADLESSGKLAQKKERNLQGEFLVDVFGRALGYTVFSDGLENWDLEPAFALPGGEADAAIGQFAPGERPPPKVLVELKGPKVNVDRHRFDGRTPVQQVWDYLNEVPDCPWGIVSNIVSFRLYHRTKTPRAYEHFRLQDLRDKNKFREFYCLFERGGFLPALAGQKPRCDDLLERSEQRQREVGGQLYARYHDERISLIRHLRRLPHKLSLDDAIHVVQKLLDRIIFVAFCEDRQLLPRGFIGEAWSTISKFTPMENPKWQNFKGLFRAVDKGNSRQGINAYNGELFKPDRLLDELELDDERTDFFKELSDYDFQDEVNVDVLGHLFEQSITDLEQLRENPDAEEIAKPTKKAGRRKREGVYYTPPFITKYIVEQAIGRCLQERYAALATSLKLDPATLPGERVGKAWARYHQGRFDILRQLRVCDPACGSGAFLIEAFNYLEGQYDDVIDDLIALGECGEDEHAKTNSTILHENLFGVDLSGEAVEITKLALWIRTAELGRPLSNLSSNIKEGNSIVADEAAHERAFEWRSSFAEIFAAGGFDVVIGNPPYVRQELLGPLKPYLQEHFRAFHGMADIYVYFYELGLRILRPGGRLSFIVTNKWMKAGYGEPLRKFFADEAWVESVVDFGHAKQIFEDADVFPSIIVAKKPNTESKPTTARLCVIPREQLLVDDLSRQIAEQGQELPLEQLRAESWQLEPAGIGELIAKIRGRGTHLTEFAGTKPYRGIVTGFNEAFLISTATREALVRADAKSDEIIKPFVRGQDVDRWRSKWDGTWMIFTRHGVTIDRYKAVKAHLTRFRQQLEPKPENWAGGEWLGRKPGPYRWFEIQDPIDYWEKFSKPKIVYQEIQFHPSYAYDELGLLGNNKVFFIPTDDLYLLAVLNSPLMWWYNWRYLPHMKDEALSPVGFLMESLPIAIPSAQARRRTTAAAKKIVSHATEMGVARKTILDWLRVEHDVEKPSLKLQSPAELDSDAFVAEVKRARGKKSLSAAAVKGLREEYTRTIEPARTLAAQSLALERELSDLVNAAYGLTPEEVALMWATAPPRMPIPSP